METQNITRANTNAKHILIIIVEVTKKVSKEARVKWRRRHTVHKREHNGKVYNRSERSMEMQNITRANTNAKHISFRKRRRFTSLTCRSKT